MRLCKVIGNVVASAKHPAYHAKTLLIMQQIDVDGSEIGASFLAVDTVQAGPGDTTLVLTEGTGVRQILNAPPSTPIRSLVVGIVDQVSIG